MSQAIERSRRLLRIGEVARQAGTSVRALRYYEEVGVLRPAARTESGYRLYDPHVLRRLETVRRMKLLGLKLADIRRLTETYEAAGACDPVRQQLEDLLRTQIRHIDGQIDELVQLKQSLQQYLQHMAGHVHARPAGLTEEHCDSELSLSHNLTRGGKPHDREPDRPPR